jgi:hypothetical protein
MPTSSRIQLESWREREGEGGRERREAKERLRVSPAPRKPDMPPDDKNEKTGCARRKRKRRSE